ncbi:MAG: glycosyl hydrolase 115 family protein [Sphingobacteriaceae bacterium]|nr:glycosyl hydrolase 115 family protein [Cytophagaceae bacterium]
MRRFPTASRILILCLLAFSGREVCGQHPSAFALVDSRQQAPLVLAANEAECVRLAVDDLVSDVQKITGRRLRVVTGKPGQRYQNSVLVGSVGKALLPDAGWLAGKWEAYRVQSQGGNLVLAGSDERGTMFAVYEFIEKFLNVDPLYFWSDREPTKRTELSWPNVSITQGTPTFRYRGWFINDEDLLTDWQRPGEPESSGKRAIDYPFYGRVVSSKTMRHVVEALVRLRQNLLIPASFIDIRNPAEAALVREVTRRGVFVSMHHVEPMGVSAFTFFNYWRQKAGLPLTGKGGEGLPLFSYFSSREKLEEVWRAYAKEWATYPNIIWQIGLRGIADRPMWLADPGIPQTDADRGRLISEAMAFQRSLIREVDRRPNPPITTTLWAEGSLLNRAGLLKIPEGVTMVFSDNSPGWRMQADFRETPRLPANTYGVYYHHQLWGSGPHLVQIVPPSRTRKVLGEVVAKGDTTYGILNVSNLREFVLGAEASARMLGDFRGFEVKAFLKTWFTERYGTAAPEVKASYQTYFDGFALNRQTGTPILMDGQIRGNAQNLLRDLQLQLSDSVQYAASRQQKPAETEERRWIKTALADLGGELVSLDEGLKRLLRQKAAHQRADSMAQRVLPRLDSTQRHFFETNLLSHLDLMIGLETWLEATMEAKRAADAGQRPETAAALTRATMAFAYIKTGLDRNRASEKWQHWYRGETKMNLTEAERLTRAVADLARALPPKTN